jgi:hypothetical protein
VWDNGGRIFSTELGEITPTSKATATELFARDQALAVSMLQTRLLREASARGRRVKRMWNGSSGGMCNIARPYGWQLVIAPETRSESLEPVPEELERIAWMAERRAEGWSFRGIARELNEQGVPTVGGGPWGHSAVAGIVRRAQASPRALSGGYRAQRPAATAEAEAEAS